MHISEQRSIGHREIYKTVTSGENIMRCREREKQYERDPLPPQQDAE